MKRIQISEFGGPEVMVLENHELPAPKSNQVQIQHKAIGLNYIDTYHRTGLYPNPLPTGLGGEAAGIVQAVGDGVSSLSVGERVAYATAGIGAYCEARNVAADQVIKIPDSISFGEAAGMMLKGMTARYLLRETYRVKAGDTIVFHAAAGGVGMIACQWAAALGVEVIGTVGSSEKAKIALENGCAHVINYNEEDVAARVREITGGKGVCVVYDGVGKDTFETSLDCLQPRGMMVSFGNASGPVTDVNLGILATKGSLFVTRPTLFHYVAKPEELAANANELMEIVASGKVKIPVNQTYALADVQQAHIDLEARKTTGTTILIP